MKVIDLINRIANREEVPEKFRYGLFELYRTKSNEIRRYYVDKEGMFFFEQYSYDLNDEIEIIKEDKKIEKIDVNHLQQIKKWKRAKVLGNKINEIIDKISSMEVK